MALGASTFTALGGAVSDLFAADALRTKARGSRIEAQEYDIAGELARQNEQFTKTSTDIKEAQASREIMKTTGQQQADVAAGGFAESGSALDLLRDSAAQGALTKAALSQQGAIEEAGYEEQSRSYQLMASASRMAADADEHAATGAGWAAALHIAGAVASVAAAPFTGGLSLAGLADSVAGLGATAESHNPGLDS